MKNHGKQEPKKQFDLGEAMPLLFERITSPLSGRNSLVKKFLSENAGKIDLTYDEGEAFKLAVSTNSTELVRILLDYYVENQLNIHKHASHEYIIAKYRLKNMLENALDSWVATDEIDDLLAPWIPEDVDSEVDEEEDLYVLDEVFVEDDDYHDNEHSPYETEVSDFCGWPESLLHHGHLSGDSANGFGEAH